VQATHPVAAAANPGADTRVRAAAIAERLREHFVTVYGLAAKPEPVPPAKTP